MRCHCRNVIACRNYTSAADANNSQQVFDEKMLEYLVCPLSKTPLRYASSCFRKLLTRCHIKDYYLNYKHMVSGMA